MSSSIAIEAVTSPRRRLALPSDAPRISALMRDSVLALFPHFYDARQTKSATLPGEPLHRSFGFSEMGAIEVTMPDGLSIACVAIA